VIRIMEMITIIEEKAIPKIMTITPRRHLRVRVSVRVRG
jgi:hypothetical protein